MTPHAALCAAPAVATALLLLAAHRAWLCRRAWVEGAAFLVILAGLAPFLSSLPPVVSRALAPFAALAAFWFAAAFGAWRFAPDVGQSGLGWPAHAAVLPSVIAGLAIACLHAALGFLPLSPLVHLACLGATAFAARPFFP